MGWAGAGRAAGAAPADDRDPAVRGRGDEAVHAQPCARVDPPLPGPGGGVGRRVLGARRGRHDDLHLPRPRPRAGDGGAAGRLVRRDPGQAARHLRRPRRVDAPDRHLGRRARLVRGRRRPPAVRLRHRLRRAGAGHRVGVAVLLRRRHDQHRGVPRGAQPGLDLEAAGRLRLREQPVRRVLADRLDDARDGAGRASGELRDPRCSHRRQRCHGRAGGGAVGPRAGGGRRRADHDRGDDLPAHGPLAQRSGDLPAGRRARGMEAARPDHQLRGHADGPRWCVVTGHRRGAGAGGDRPSPRRCSARSTGPNPIRRAGSTTSGRPEHERAADLSRRGHPRARRRAGERRAGGADRRGRRRSRRRVQGDRGAVRAVRLAAGARYADLGAGDRRHRAGRGGGRAAAGRRDHVRRLRGRLLRPDRQPAGQVPVPVRRPGDRPGDAADGRRRQSRLRRAALAVRRELVPQHARPEAVRSGDAGRRLHACCAPRSATTTR